MPRTVQEILDHADELARRFEDYQPKDEDRRDVEPRRALASAASARAQAEREVAQAVRRARASGYSWKAIGEMLGTSGEAARLRYRGVSRARQQAAKAKAAKRRVNA